MHSSGPVGRHRQLVLVLEAELYLIPFALLKGSSSNEYLYERFSLIAVPSIQALSASAKVGSVRLVSPGWQPGISHSVTGSLPLLLLVEFCPRPLCLFCKAGLPSSHCSKGGAKATSGGPSFAPPSILWWLSRCWARLPLFLTLLERWGYPKGHRAQERQRQGKQTNKPCFLPRGKR